MGKVHKLSVELLHDWLGVNVLLSVCPANGRGLECELLENGSFISFPTLPVYLFVCRRFLPRKVEMDAAAALDPTVLIPFIAADDFAYFVLNSIVVDGYAKFSAKDFKYFDILCAALASRGVTAACVLTNHQFDNHLVSTFLPSNKLTNLWNYGGAQ